MEGKGGQGTMPKKEGRKLRKEAKGGRREGR